MCGATKTRYSCGCGSATLTFNTGTGLCSAYIPNTNPLHCSHLIVETIPSRRTCRKLDCPKIPRAMNEAARARVKARGQAIKERRERAIRREDEERQRVKARVVIHQWEWEVAVEDVKESPMVSIPDPQTETIEYSPTAPQQQSEPIPRSEISLPRQGSQFERWNVKEKEEKTGRFCWKRFLSLLHRFTRKSKSIGHRRSIDSAFTETYG